MTDNTHDEVIPPGEADDIAAITRISLAILDTSRCPVRRGQHPKQHGCVRGDFIVDADIPEELRHGVFRTARSFPAWVRFSNGSQDDDSRGDIHGMAIKLIGVDGRKILPGEENETTQDFVLMDHPVFFSRNARSNRALAETIQRSMRPSLLQTMLFWIQDSRNRRSAYIALRNFIFRFRFHELSVLRAATSKKPLSPLSIRYWSATPYALGPLVVKYSAQPQRVPVDPPASPLAPDHLRAAMSKQLAQNEARFDFLVQVRTKPHQPVEDASIEWSETDAPFCKVATLVIPQQTFELKEQMKCCENLCYTPWHTLPAHRPLGGVNRVRRAVYEILSRKRLDVNGVRMREPTASDLGVST